MTVTERPEGLEAVQARVENDQDHVTTILWRDGETAGQPFQLEDLSEIKDQDVLFWVDLLDVNDGDDALLRKLADELGFSPADVQLAIDNGVRPKAARHATHTFITTYATALDTETQRGPLDSRVMTSRISVFLLPHGLVTIRHDHVFDMEKLVDRWSADKHLRELGPGALLYDLFDLLVDEQFDTISGLDNEIEALECSLFTVISPDEEAKGTNLREANRRFQLDVFRLRKDLVKLRQVVLPMREVVKTVDHDPLGGATDDRLDNLYDELYEQILRLTDWTDSLHDMVTAVYETNLSVQDAALNEVMKKLTGWAAIIAVPTLITGWFGQNVYYPGANAPSGLVASTVMILVLALPLWWFFRKRAWI